MSCMHSAGLYTCECDINQYIFTMEVLAFVLPWCLSVAAEIMLLDEPLDGVALLGIGR